MSQSLIWDILRRMPPSLLRKLGRYCAALHYALDGRHVQECERMVEICRADWDARAIVKGMYQSLWQIPSDLCFAFKLKDAELDRHVIGLEAFLAKLSQLAPEEGVIFVTAHIGAWELSSQITSRRFKPISSVYKSSRFEWVNRFLRASREQHGQQMIEKEGSIVRLFKELKRGGAVGLVMDQHGGTDGVPSRFLGKPCLSWDSAVMLAQRSGCPVMAVGFLRQGQGYRVSFSDFIKFPKKFRDEAERLEAVASVDEALSHLVEQAPEQWMWLGRRWGRNFEAIMAGQMS